MGKRFALIGLQAGDEGKRKVETWMLEQAVKRTKDPSKVLVERWHGGPNAGGSVRMNNVSYKFHGLPSGLMIDGTYNLVSGGVFVDPKQFIDEEQKLTSQGLIVTPKNLGIAANAHVLLDFHRATDLGGRVKINNNASSHTTTGSGMGPVASDKYSRKGINIMQFMDEDFFRKKILERFPEGEITVPNKDNSAMQTLSVDQFVESYKEAREHLRPFVVDETSARKINSREYILCAGVHGHDLDNTVGQYPGTTPSEAARVPSKTDIIVGVFKLYYSNVGWGNRSFISNFGEDLTSQVRDKWAERGTKTGLPRDLGWFDVVSARHAILDTEVDCLALTCGDRLVDLHGKVDKLKIVVAYKIDGKEYTTWQAMFSDVRTLQRAEPVFEYFDTFDKFTDEFGKLTPKAQSYVNRIEELIGMKFSLVGTGPDSKEMIVIENPFDKNN